MVNQYSGFPIGRLQNVEVDLVGVKTVVDFEVIEIIGEKDPYPTLLGIDWAYENYVVIDIKKEAMTFESDGMKVTQPLDPYQDPWYTELVDCGGPIIIGNSILRLLIWRFSRNEDIWLG
jgi:hypothetical protein